MEEDIALVAKHVPQPVKQKGSASRLTRIWTNLKSLSFKFLPDQVTMKRHILGLLTFFSSKMFL